MEILEKFDVEPILPRSSISDLAISPDGKKIAFTRNVTNNDEDRYESHLWITSENAEPQQFTYGLGNDSSPIWSRNGNTIYFLSTRQVKGQKKDKTRLWAIQANGGEARLVVEVKNSIESPILSPDGNKVLFLSSIEEDSEARGDSEESDVLWIKKLIYKRDGALKFNPYTRKHVLVSSIDEGEYCQLTCGPYDVLSCDWSPDGDKIAFVTNIEDYDRSNFRDVYIVSTDGGNPKKVTNGRIMATTVAWSPDGKYIAYTGFEPYDINYRGWRNSEIWVISREGGEPVNLTKKFDRTIRSYFTAPIWSSDSKFIYFSAPNHGSTLIYKVALDTQNVEPIVEGKRELITFDMVRDGSLFAFISSQPTSLHEIWLHGSKGSKQLTKLNVGLFTEYKWSEPEEFWFEAGDGEKIQGWIMKPVDFDEKKKYPTVIDVHGGPMGFHGYGFRHGFQVLARHGYVVVYTNPRMSTGYGEKFAAECCGHYGEKDYSDVMEAVDYIVETYLFVDENKLGIQGHSYGGFLMNWIIGQTNRFKSCVSTASISNWDSFFGVSDIGTFWVPWQVGFGKDPWEERQLHIEKSPFSYAGNVETPTLYMHPEKDYRCPLDQSEQLYVALKKRKIETELIIFPDEHHLLPISGKPSHRREWMRHKLRWFGKFLK